MKWYRDKLKPPSDSVTIDRKLAEKIHEYLSTSLNFVLSEKEETDLQLLTNNLAAAINGHRHIPNRAA